MGIYFESEEHEKNYERVLSKWLSRGSMDTEYKVSCYILAVPMIYDKVEHLIDEFELPVDWIWRWEWKYTLSKLDAYSWNKEELEEIPYDLTDSMVQLGRLSLNLWNRYEHFNLLDCISSLDSSNYKVLKCAIDMRMGHFTLQRG